MRFGLPFRKPTPPTPAPRRRPTPEEQCTETALSTGERCGQWAKDGPHCKKHANAPKRQPAALTASVSVVQLDSAGWQTWKFGSRDWQIEAWRLYDIVGPLRFVANWVGNSVSRCRLYVAEVDEAGEPGEEATDPDIAQLAGGLLGQGPAKDEALRLLGINLFVAGEAYIIAEADALEGGGDRWFVVPGRHIHRSGNKVTIRRSQLDGGGEMLYREGIDLIIRVWTPHPNDTDEPDSSARSAIPELRKIEAIGKREFAELDSRLTGAGLLLLPDNIDFPRGGDDQPTGVEGFSNLLQRVAATSLQDRSSAEAMVPIAITVPPESVDKIKHLNFWSGIDEQLLPLAEAAYKALGMALDVPPEVLTGQGETNHWSAWAISGDAISIQIVPVLSRIADAGTTGYLRGALEELGKDPKAHVYAFDTAALSTRPNRAADALNFHKEGILSDLAAIEAGAFNEDQMPDDTERIRRLVQTAVASMPALLAESWARDIIGIKTGPDPVAIAPAPAPAPAPETPAPVKDPESPPEQTPQTEEAAALVAVSNLAMRRALALAGGRLVPHRQRDRYEGTDRHQLHTRFGSVTRERAEIELRGAWADLPAVAEDLHVDPAQLEALLHGFAVELLTRGMAYDVRLLRELVVAAVRGRRLNALAEVAA